MTVKEFNNRIDKLIVALGNPTLDIVERTGLNALASIRRRIIDTGKGADQQVLKPYSPAYLQFKKDVGRYRGHVDYQLGNYSIQKRIDAVNRRKKARKIDSQTYDLFREEAGFAPLNRPKKKKKTKAEKKEAVVKKQKRVAKAIPTTGQLWRSIGVVEKKDNAGKLVVSIGALDKLNQDKLARLSSKRGEVLGMTVVEQKEAADKFEKEFGDLVNKIFR